MLTMLQRPVVIPFRWVGHALDVRAHHNGHELLFNALDVCIALGILVELATEDWVTGREPRVFPLPTTLVDGTIEPDGAPSEYFTTDQVRELALDRPMIAHDDFLDWFEHDVLGNNNAAALDVFERAIDPEPGLKAARTYEIAEVARILSRDPLLAFGQRSLFEALHTDLGWIHRERDVWVPTEETLRAGWLLRMKVRVPGRKVLYPQIRVTPAGVEQLHARLGGIGTLTLDVDALTLPEL
jgi:hypothetical protein